MSIAASATLTTPLSGPCQGFITQLVLRCGQGDARAMGELFDLTFALVAAAVNRGAPSAGGADEQIVEAFGRIWGRASGYEPTERGVVAWVVEQALDRQTAIA
jgi:hypothetical protein